MIGRLIAGAAVAAAFPAAAETLRCAPMWPTFCANVHVSCAGRSDIPTQAFTVRFGAAAAEVAFADGARWRARVTEWDSGRVLRPAEGRDWIRIDRAGRFSQRIHRGGASVMSTGPCRAEQELRAEREEERDGDG